MLFRGIFVSFSLGHASIWTSYKACFRASNNLKFKIFPGLIDACIDACYTCNIPARAETSCGIPVKLSLNNMNTRTSPTVCLNSKMFGESFNFVDPNKNVAK